MTKSEDKAHDKAVSDIKAAEQKTPTTILNDNVTSKLAFLGTAMLIIILMGSALYLLASEDDAFDSNGKRINANGTLEAATE